MIPDLVIGFILGFLSCVSIGSAYLSRELRKAIDATRDASNILREAEQLFDEQEAK